MKFDPRDFLLFIICFLAFFLPAHHLPVHYSYREALPVARLIPAQKFLFRCFVDCNMASVWIGDSFRIFPCKYGEDLLRGEFHELTYASGQTVDEVFGGDPSEFREPVCQRMHRLEETVYTEPSGLNPCIRIPRNLLSSLDESSGNANRRDGYAFVTNPDSTGMPLARLQIPLPEVVARLLHPILNFTGTFGKLD